MPTAEAVKQRNLEQYGTETSNYMEDPFAPPSRAVGQTLAGISSDYSPSPKPTLTTTEKYERDQARESASSDRIDRERNEQRIRDIVSGAIQPKDIDEEREFAGVKAAMTGWDE
jgi:hypothetical protein